ncbi:beta-propeller fold lactonase family protein [candidate division WOR-3 bacterium]|nr:beta-propeller fold lactonase family protein [candidate division WOR-3 bacterium]
MRKWHSHFPVGVIVFATLLSLTCQPPANNPPTTPATPSGPTTGQVGVAYDFSSSSTDPDEDGVAIRFDWGNGVVSNWSSFVTSGQQVTISYSYQTAGTFNVRAQAMDDDGDTSDWSAAHQITISAGSTNNPPNTPATPSGPATGEVGVSYDFVSSSTDPDGDSVSIRFDWGDGNISNWSSYVASGANVTASHSYLSVGTYNVKAQAKDIHGDTSAWSGGHQITIQAPVNNPPNTPAIPSGPATGEVGVSYDFVSSSTDPDGDSVSIRFDWGNGVVSNWSSFVTSGQQVTMSYSYQTAGTYYVKAQAKDVHGDTSAWSGGHQITISSGGYPNQIVATVSVDPSPEGLDALPSGEYVYVANLYSDEVSVIRTSDNTVVATVAVGDGPYDVAALPNGEYVYVANYNSDNVSVIRTSDNTVVATVSVGNEPYSLAASPNSNYVYVTNLGSDNVSVIRTSDNTVVATVGAGSDPYDVAVLPNGAYVYVANYTSNNVSVIRTSDHTVVATVAVGGGPRGLAALPNGEYVYVANNNLARVSVIRTSDNTVVATVSVGTRPLGVAVLPNGQYVYVANRDDDAVSVIRTSTNTVVETVTVGDQPVGVAVLPNGNFVYVSNYGTNDVTVLGQ